MLLSNPRCLFSPPSDISEPASGTIASTPGHALHTITSHNSTAGDRIYGSRGGQGDRPDEKIGRCHTARGSSLVKSGIVKGTDRLLPIMDSSYSSVLDTTRTWFTTAWRHSQVYPTSHPHRCKTFRQKLKKTLKTQKGDKNLVKVCKRCIKCYL